MDNTDLANDNSFEISGFKNRMSVLNRSQHGAPRSRADSRPSNTQNKVFVVDGSEAIREAVGDLLKEDGYLVETFATGLVFLGSYRRDDDDRACLLVDALLLGMSGIDLVEYLRAEGDQIPAIVFSGHADVPMAVQAMKVGAVDFLEKPVGCDALLASIRRALERGQETAELSNFLKASARSVASLTCRQKEILDLIRAGHPSKNIAADLRISQRTVENHRAVIAAKTGSKSMSALIHTAVCADCSLNQFKNHPITDAAPAQSDFISAA
jgi:two-component system, chemotaxis family, CheB/CheR fusion protein